MLWLVSLYNFALYHTSVEFITIAISVAIFMLVWNSRRIIDNNYLLFIGITFVFIAILDFFHTLVYQGVGIFPDGGGALSTRFWIGARYLQAVTFLAAPLFIRRNIRLDLVAFVYLAADALIIASIFVFNTFPVTYIPGTGLTPFKIVSEYIISLLLIASVVLLYRNREAFDRQVFNNLVIAIFLIIASELTFTEYASFTDIFSLLGHVFRVVAYFFFYRAIIEVGQEKPYNLIYRNLTESEDRMGFALETIHAGAWDLDLVDHTAHRTPEHDRIFGYPELLPHWTYEMFLEHVVPEDRKEVDEKFRHATAIQGDWNFECRIRRTDGAIRWIQAAGRHRKGDPGTHVRMSGIVQDITGRKVAEEALQKSEARLRSVLDNSPNVIYRFNLQTRRYEYFSPASSAVSEFTPEEMGAMTESETWDRVHPDDLPGFEAAMARIREAGSGEAEIRWRHRSGKYIWLQINFHITPGEDGRPLFRDGFVRDTTLRREAEEALRESEERFRLALKNAPVSVAVQDRNLVYRWAYNQRTRRSDEIIGMTDADLFAPEDLAWLVPLKQRVLECGTEEHREHWVTSNGQRLFVDLFLEPIRNNAGEITGIGIATVDRTELKHAEDSLREAHQRTATLLESISDSFLALDRDWRFTYINRKAAPPGTATEELIGRRIWDIYPQILGTPLEEFYRKAMEEQKPLVFENRSTVVPGRVFELHSYPTEDGGIAVFGEDVTGRRQMEEDLKRRNELLMAAHEEITASQEELQQNVEQLSLREQDLMQSEAKLKEALAEKEILLSEIHHRVKNNLAAFISLLSLDGSYEDTETGRALRKDLQNRARSMALIHETLYRTGKFSNVDMDVYLTTLVSQVAATFRGKINVDTVVHARDVVLDLARATTTGLIINELVTNSFKYAFQPPFDCETVRGEPCTIRISITEKGGIFILSVADNGTGLPADLDPLAARSLGLRLVNFLARHQLRAEMVVRKNNGTEYIFRFSRTEDHP